MDVWERGDYKLYLSLHCHHQNDSCIKMAGYKSHSNISLIITVTFTRVSINHNIFDEKGEPKRN